MAKTIICSQFWSVGFVRMWLWSASFRGHASASLQQVHTYTSHWLKHNFLLVLERWFCARATAVKFILLACLPSISKSQTMKLFYFQNMCIYILRFDFSSIFPPVLERWFYKSYCGQFFLRTCQQSFSQSHTINTILWCFQNMWKNVAKHFKKMFALFGHANL